jgi:FSR family fosmidomycin resistance protein-like MFS transporter
VIILAGGIGFSAACFLTATSHSFIPLLLAFILFFPSSGAFVSLSQSTLMDHDPARHEHNMARWTFAGSLGVVGGSLALGAVAAIAPESSWRGLLMFAALLTIVLWLMLYRLPMPATTNGENSDGSKRSFRDGVRDTIQALRRPDVLRWLTLLQFSELMLDILHGYIALYFVDVVGTHEGHATLAVAVWSGVGLIGDFLLIPLLERVRGLDYLRVSAAIEFVLFPAFLLAPGIIPKFVILGLLGFFNAGWYSVLQGQVYSAMPGQSGAVLAIDNIASLVGRILPFGIGLAAERFGLGAAMWLFVLGPIALLIGLPRRATSTDVE